jgi:hypothetical protein
MRSVGYSPNYLRYGHQEDKEKDVKKEKFGGQNGRPEATFT